MVAVLIRKQSLAFSFRERCFADRLKLVAWIPGWPNIRLDHFQANSVERFHILLHAGHIPRLIILVHGLVVPLNAIRIGKGSPSCDAAISRIDPAIGEILLPGEKEFRTARQRNREGIEIDDVTWSRICAAGEELGLRTQGW